MTRTILGSILAGALLFAACGDDDTPDDATPTTEPSSDTTGATATGDVVTVDIAGFQFNPSEITISEGQSVVWTNSDSFAHTARGDDFDTDSIAGGESSEPEIFDEAGTYDYICGIHNSMTGTIVVA